MCTYNNTCTSLIQKLINACVVILLYLSICIRIHSVNCMTPICLPNVIGHSSDLKLCSLFHERDIHRVYCIVYCIGCLVIINALLYILVVQNRTKTWAGTQKRRYGQRHRRPMYTEGDSCSDRRKDRDSDTDKGRGNIERQPQRHRYIQKKVHMQMETDKQIERQRQKQTEKQRLTNGEIKFWLFQFNDIVPYRR